MWPLLPPHWGVFIVYSTPLGQGVNGSNAYFFWHDPELPNPVYLHPSLLPLGLLGGTATRAALVPPGNPALRSGADWVVGVSGLGLELELLPHIIKLRHGDRTPLLHLWLPASPQHCAEASQLGWALCMWKWACI